DSMLQNPIFLLDTRLDPHAIINLTHHPTRPPTGGQPPGDWRIRLSDKRAENIPTSILCPLFFYLIPDKEKNKMLNDVKIEGLIAR
ncbi:MAG: hypothetical protein R6W69_14290, partial [Anaerolineales bacterium]